MRIRLYSPQCGPIQPRTVTVDLMEQKVVLPDGSAVTFPIDEFARHCMLEGVDELGYILQQETAIASLRQSGS